ncbi:MAG TPA: flagellar filament capping protein FliD [Ilumatobacteraceae bacterium]|nr:flagellar filament capping protein FliD [Ilumatobacteraceae bacterium]
MAIPIVSFTAGGIDVESIVQGLMQVERQPINMLQVRQQKAQLQTDALQRLRNSLDSLKSMANAVITNGISKLSSSVSSPTAVTASLSPFARAGSVTFTVDQLARAHGLRSATTVASSSSVITTASTIALSTNAVGVGISSVQAGAGVVAGNYTVSVLQATAGATRNGSSPLAASTLIDGTNNTLNLELDGVATAPITIASGTYDAAGLLTAVQTAIAASPAAGRVTAALDATGRLRLTSTHEGSDAKLQVMGGGSANSALGLTDFSQASGTDGTIQIGTEPISTVTSAGSGATVSVDAGAGNIDVTLDGGLRVGDAKVAVVSTGDRSLASVAAAINGANAGANAAAVKIADGAWILQLSSSKSGTDNALALDATAFSSVGGLLQTSGAQDAKITIGTGPGAYSVEASGNSFTDVLSGVTLTAVAESATPVTVSVSRNDSATADGVGQLIAAANSLLADIKLQTSYNAATKTSSPLTTDSSVRRLAEEVRATVTALVKDGDTRLASSIGISSNSAGQLVFDKAAFITALSANPGGVERLFGRGGTATGPATFATATDATIAGEYGVVVTVPPKRASTGEILTADFGAVIGVRVGAVSATFQPAPGATAADIVAGLNEALASSGLKINAEATAGGVSLTAVGYGNAGSFETDLDMGAGWQANTGTDVAGTIDGKVAIGSGQRLRLLDTDTSPARGLGVDVAEGALGALPNVTYEPGIAARLVSLAVARTGEHGALSSSKTTYDSRIKSFTEQIERFESKLVAREANMRRQWTAVQTLLSSLQNQGDWLSSQASAANNNNNS